MKALSCKSALELEDNDGTTKIEVLAKSVPAAAVIQTVRALFSLNGCKGYVGGYF